MLNSSKPDLKYLMKLFLAASTFAVAIVVASAAILVGDGENGPVRGSASTALAAGAPGATTSAAGGGKVAFVVN